MGGSCKQRNFKGKVNKIDTYTQNQKFLEYIMGKEFLENLAHTGSIDVKKGSVQ